MSEEVKTLVSGESRELEQEQNPGSSSQDWKSGIESSYLENESIKTYVEKGDLNGLLKDYVNKEKMVGQKTTPKADADWSEWSGFLREKGVIPKEIQEYGVTDESLAEFVKTAHDSGLSKAQMDRLMDHMRSEKARLDESYSQQYQSAYNKLVEKYGGEEQAKEVLSQADKYASETFGDFPEFFDFLSNTEIETPGGEKVLLGNHPLMAEALKVMFEKTADDSKKIEGSAPASAEDVTLEFEKLTTQMAGYQGDSSDPEYREMQKKYNEVKKKLLGL